MEEKEPIKIRFTTILIMILILIIIGLLGYIIISKNKEGSTQQLSDTSNNMKNADNITENKIDNAIGNNIESNEINEDENNTNDKEEKNNNTTNTNSNNMNKDKDDIANYNNIEENIISSKDEENKYFEILENKRKYVNESKKEIYLSRYVKEISDTEKADISYALVDLDNDKANEMVVLISTYDGFILILNYDDGKIYGFEESARGMSRLKTDGTYSGSSGADSEVIERSEFSQNKRIRKVLAEMDGKDLKIDGKSVSKKKWNKYFEQFMAKEDVEFIEYSN